MQYIVQGREPTQQYGCAFVIASHMLIWNLFGWS